MCRGNVRAFDRRPILPECIEDATDILVVDLPLLFNKAAEFFEDSLTLLNVILVPLQLELVAPQNHVNAEKLAHLSQVLVAGPE